MFKLLVLVIVTTMITAKKRRWWMVVNRSISYEEYYQLPAVFEVQDYEKCLSQRENAYCAGAFELSSPGPSQLYDVLKKYSANQRHNFNHTRIHRAVCLGPNSGCPVKNNLTESFKECIDKSMFEEYGLRADLMHFDFCRKSGEKPIIDNAGVAFCIYLTIVVVLNVIGTVYDWVLKNSNANAKGNRWLMAFSIFDNWRRLTSMSEGKDTRFQNLSCFNGIKILENFFMISVYISLPLSPSLPLSLPRSIPLSHSPDHPFSLPPSLSLYHLLSVSLFFALSPAHSVNAVNVHSAVWARPYTDMFEFTVKSKIHRRGLAAVMMKAQAFLRAFYQYPENMRLVARMLSEVTELVPDASHSTCTIMNIHPVHLTTIGIMATIFIHLNDGPLWYKHIGMRMDRYCKWWTGKEKRYREHPMAAIEQTGLHCLVCYAQWRSDPSIVDRRVLEGLDPEYILRRLLLGSLILLFAIAYLFELEPQLLTIKPENILTFFAEDTSQVYLYASAWGNLPAAIAGLLLAATYYRLQREEIDPTKNRIFVAMYHLSPPLSFLWSLMPFFFSNLESRLAVSLYATAEKSVFAAVLSVTSLGCFYKVEGPMTTILCWPGWAGAQPAVSEHAVGAPAGQHPDHFIQNSQFHVTNANGLTPFYLFLISFPDLQLADTAAVSVIGYLLALPLALLIEYPAARLYEAVVESRSEENTEKRTSAKSKRS
ncbi:hypothetical protein EVAR_46814_1 [Eumeta japonica]|uniref:Nose resistant to fluoxetine protein 6 n=1 Tax=Eumeta variegata TaxID=151549 RepID=A0A4C1XB98_EUMVA|nr:hypothetical protein EVAR_46814_1 [Eumeta japonica]